MAEDSATPGPKARIDDARRRKPLASGSTLMVVGWHRTPSLGAGSKGTPPVYPDRSDESPSPLTLAHLPLRIPIQDGWAGFRVAIYLSSWGKRMAEQLHQYARVHEIVPVESWSKDGVEGWLFRDKKNQTIFVESSKLLGHQLAFEVN